MTKKRDVTLTKSEALKESWKNRKDFLNEELVEVHCITYGEVRYLLRKVRK